MSIRFVLQTAAAAGSLSAMHAAAFPSWFGPGRRLPSRLWRTVRKVAGCTQIQELPCPDAWAVQLSNEMMHVPRELILGAGVEHLFIAVALQVNGIAHHGIAYEKGTQRWLGLDRSLFDRETYDDDFKVPRLRAVLLEEIVHVWDYSLESRHSPYASSGTGVTGSRWREVECSATGSPRPFAIRNRKPDNRIVEDWASAVLWYVFRPDHLKAKSRSRHDFAAELFRTELGLS